MNIRWSPNAADDFTRIVEYIRERNLAAADRVSLIIHDATSVLRRFPNAGRAGRVVNTRELILAPLPFIIVYRVREQVIVYRVREQVIEIVRILHGAQKWPSP
jgi:toxin ParE1/3/4